MATDDTKAGMAGAPRYVYGPRPVGALVPRLTRPAFRRRAPATAQVMADWAAIVGPALAAVTTPRRLHGGTLAIACNGPIAVEMQHLSTELMARINAHLGRQAVERLRFVQDAPPSVAAAPAKPVSQAVEQAALARVAGLRPGPLRDALASLGRAVLNTDGDAKR